MAQEQDSSRKGLPIRLQITIVVGLLQILALFIATHGFFTLQSYQKTINEDLYNANRAEQLSETIQAEFLLARQNEAEIINKWRLAGLSETLETQISENKYHLANARVQLNLLENLIINTDDIRLKDIESDIENLKPLFDQYDVAFDSTIELIRDRTSSGGLDSTLAVVNDRLLTGFEPLQDVTYLKTAFQMYEAEQNYYSTRRQEYVDSYRIQNNNLAARIAESTPADIAGSPLTIPMMKGLINDQYRYFNEIVKLEQSIEINTNLFQETSVSINKLIDSITSKSSSSGIQTRAAITAQGRQATITIIVASVVVLVLGVTIGAIYSITLARPIHQLANAAAEMGAGKLDEKVSIRGPREINQLADNFNTMAGQLAETLAGLESRVEERTKALARRSTQLQASAEVARDATSIRDLNVLLNQTANLIRERFGFYHAGIFLVDPKHEYAILRASTGEAGREMLSRKHKLKVGETGIVGRVCATGEPLISLDVGAEAVHFRNPLLPDTRSEMALPLKAGRIVIGAIDVQSTEPAAFDEQDVAVLQSMADQLAVAIENARLFSESQENIQQLQTIYGSYSKKAWDVITAIRKQFGYAYEDGQLVPLTEGKTESAPLSIPLAVRGQEIGSLEIWPNEHGLSENDRAVIVSLGDRIGQAMESARLYEEAQSRATREQSLSQLTAMFTRSLSFETILKTAVQELGKMPNVTEASIQLEIPEQEER